MAEFDFILSPEDQKNLIQYILDSGAILVPYLAYCRAEYEIIKESNKLVDLIVEKKLFGPVFISWDDYENFPYGFDAVEREEGLRYFLKQKNGGPYIDFLPCNKMKHEGKCLLTSGFIGYYDKYWIDKLGKEILVCPELKSKYRDITTYLKKRCSRTKAGQRTYWIGEQAMKDLKNECQASVDGLELPI